MTIWYILWLFGIFYGNLVYFMVIWYILWLFGIFYGYLVYFMATYLVYFMVIWYIFSPVLVCCTKKNRATLGPSGKRVYILVRNRPLAPELGS
jgi:hypothetical protein